MKLTIRQRASTVGDKYDIYDEHDNTVLTARADNFAQGNKMYILNDKLEEVALITRKILIDEPTYEIKVDHVVLATLREKPTWRKTTIEVGGDQENFLITGDFVENDYSIQYNGDVLGTVRRPSWKDAYILDIQEEEKKEFFVAVVLTMDHILSQKEK